MKPWETARTATPGLNTVSMDGGLSQLNLPVGNPFVKKYSKTHFPKATIGEFIDNMVVAEEEAVVVERFNGEEGLNQTGAMTMNELSNKSMTGFNKQKIITVVEYDESLSNLWRQMRIV